MQEALTRELYSEGGYHSTESSTKKVYGAGFFQKIQQNVWNYAKIPLCALALTAFSPHGGEASSKYAEAIQNIKSIYSDLAQKYEINVLYFVEKMNRATTEKERRTAKCEAERWEDTIEAYRQLVKRLDAFPYTRNGVIAAQDEGKRNSEHVEEIMKRDCGEDSGTTETAQKTYRTISPNYNTTSGKVVNITNDAETQYDIELLENKIIGTEVTVTRLPDGRTENRNPCLFEINLSAGQKRILKNLPRLPTCFATNGEYAVFGLGSDDIKLYNIKDGSISDFLRGSLTHGWPTILVSDDYSLDNNYNCVAFQEVKATYLYGVEQEWYHMLLSTKRKRPLVWDVRFADPFEDKIAFISESGRLLVEQIPDNPEVSNFKVLFGKRLTSPSGLAFRDNTVLVTSNLPGVAAYVLDVETGTLSTISEPEALGSGYRLVREQPDVHRGVGAWLQYTLKNGKRESETIKISDLHTAALSTIPLNQSSVALKENTSIRPSVYVSDDGTLRVAWVQGGDVYLYTMDRHDLAQAAPEKQKTGKSNDKQKTAEKQQNPLSQDDPSQLHEVKSYNINFSGLCDITTVAKVSYPKSMVMGKPYVIEVTLSITNPHACVETAYFQNGLVSCLYDDAAGKFDFSAAPNGPTVRFYDNAWVAPDKDPRNKSFFDDLPEEISNYLLSYAFNLIPGAGLAKDVSERVLGEMKENKTVRYDPNAFDEIAVPFTTRMKTGANRKVTQVRVKIPLIYEKSPKETDIHVYYSYDVTPVDLNFKPDIFDVVTVTPETIGPR